MWDLFRDLTDSTRYLILRKRGGFPVHLVRTDWGFVRTHGSVAQDLAEKIIRNGFVIISSHLPYDGTETIGESPPNR